MKNRNGKERGGYTMNILMLTGSPRKKGVTAHLADAFVKGAEEAGHRVERFDAARMNISPCKGCYACHKKGKCVFDDDMAPLLGRDGKILSADLIVLVTPIYYFSMTAQLKTVLDRFYSLGHEIWEEGQKAVLIAAGGDSEPEVMDGLSGTYHSLCKWSHWQDLGTFAALGCHEVEDLTEETLEKVYSFARNLK